MTNDYLNMTTQPHGGPAFPVAPCVKANGDIIHGCGGMTLRDWFAGQLISNPDVTKGFDDRAELANHCYAIADAMLMRRES